MVESGWPVRNEPHEFPVRGSKTGAMPLKVSIINDSGTTAKYWSYRADAASLPAPALVMLQQTCFLGISSPLCFVIRKISRLCL